MRLFISIPMFSAIFACRAFTLAVFLREVLQEVCTAQIYNSSSTGIEDPDPGFPKSQDPSLKRKLADIF